MIVSRTCPSESTCSVCSATVLLAATRGGLLVATIREGMMADGALSDRFAIVTGAAQGLGFAIAARFVAEGASIVMADIQSDKLAAAARRVDGGIGRAIAVEVDVTSAASVDAMVAAAVSRFGHLDLLVNVAGGSGRHLVDAIEETSDAAFDGVIAANLRGTFLCCRAAVPHLHRSRDGRILNFSSGAVQGVAGKTTIAAPLAYAAAKAGIHGLTNQLAKELAQTGVAVNVLQPGFVLTEKGARVRELFDRLTDAERATMLAHLKVPPREPEEVGFGVTWLMSERARGLTGTCVRLSGKIRNSDLTLVPEGQTPLGSFARLEPASAS
jgi:NAD(P)-dependent dehydrogenase (short-subunit alcohol dehydrogenase family)